MKEWFDFAVVTIFAREVLEAAIIIGNYRTILQRTHSPHFTREQGLREVTLSAALATLLALIMITGLAIPLALLSSKLDPTMSNITEAVSKMVAAISLLQLSLKLPKWLGVYASSKPNVGLTLSSIRFNVGWNVWREVAECGVFLIPFFLASDTQSIPFSAVVGAAVGFVCGMLIYIANQRLQDKRFVATFCVLVLVILSAGLWTNGCHKIEKEVSPTPTVWSLEDEFWSVNRLPMTVLKPFGYNDSRTILEMSMYWGSLLLAALLHLRKYRLSPRPDSTVQGEGEDEDQSRSSSKEEETLELGVLTVDTMGSAARQQRLGGGEL